jgi:hypothetical protein
VKYRVFGVFLGWPTHPYGRLTRDVRYNALCTRSMNCVVPHNYPQRIQPYTAYSRPPCEHAVGCSRVPAGSSRDCRREREHTSSHAEEVLEDCKRYV